LILVDANVLLYAYLAALALESGATLATTDRDFSRFPGLKLLDPAA
jgi:predicted nucleic acid-binding protein